MSRALMGLGAGGECATLVVVLLSTEPDPATRYFSLRERQARALAARLLLPTLHEIVRGAEPEPLQQVESLLAALALQGPNGRALAISMLHHLVEHQGAMAAGPLSRARAIRTRLARLFLRLVDGLFDGDPPGATECEAIAGCLDSLRPALERGGGHLLARLNDRLFPLLLERIPLSPALPSAVRLWLSCRAHDAVDSNGRSVHTLHDSHSMNAMAIFQWYRDSVHPRLREALFELLFRTVVSQLEAVDHHDAAADADATAPGDAGAKTGSKADMCADVAMTLRGLCACGMARDIARRPQLLTPLVLERVISERLTRSGSAHDGGMRSCATCVLDDWHSSFVEPSFEPCDEPECGCLDDGPVCCARRALLRAAHAGSQAEVMGVNASMDTDLLDAKIDLDRKIAAECWLARSIMLLGPSKCEQGGDSGNDTDTDELLDTDKTRARQLFVQLAHSSEVGGRDTFVRVLRASVFQELGCGQSLDEAELELGEDRQLITPLLRHASAACDILVRAATISAAQAVLCVDMLCELLLLLLPPGQRKASHKHSDVKENANADMHQTSSDAIDAHESAIAEVLRLLCAQGSKACRNFRRAELIGSSFLCKVIQCLQLNDDATQQTQSNVMGDTRAVSAALLVLRCRKSGDTYDEAGGAEFFEPLTRSNNACVARFASGLMLHRQRIEKPQQHQRALRSVLRESQLQCDTSLLDCPKRLYHACAAAAESEEACTGASESLGFTACLDAGLASSFAAFTGITGEQLQHSS